MHRRCYVCLCCVLCEYMLAHTAPVLMASFTLARAAFPRATLCTKIAACSGDTLLVVGGELL